MHGDLTKSVLAVPPLARKPDFTLDRAANAALIRHIEQGGVSTLMYGGNANFYNVGLYEYEAILDMLLDLAGPQTWVIPSAGPDFGRLMDQAEALRKRPFPTAMILPAAGFFTSEGVETAVGRFVDSMRKPAILYLKAEAYLAPSAIARMVRQGIVKAIKYGIVREVPARDSYLTELLNEVDRAIVISGMGERPAIAHWRDFGLRGFTSGSVCVAPRASQGLLSALKRGDYAMAEKLRSAFMPLEDCRDAWNPVRVLHEAIMLSGIADMGPMLPLMSNLAPTHADKVRTAAIELLRFSNALALPAEDAA